MCLRQMTKSDRRDIMLLIYAVTEEIAFVMRTIVRVWFMQLISTVADMQQEVI